MSVVQGHMTFQMRFCDVSGAAESGGSPEADAAAIKPAARLAIVFGREESGLQVCLFSPSKCDTALALPKSCTRDAVPVLCTCHAWHALRTEGALHVPQATVHAMHVPQRKSSMPPDSPCAAWRETYRR